MKTNSRIVVAIALVAGLGGLLAWLARAPAAPASNPGTNREPAPTFQSSAECRACHQDVWDEWHGSHHQISYLNPEVRALSDDFRNKDCQACHLPRPVSLTGYGQRVLPRQTHPDEGVGCLACHQDVDGAILGRHAAPDAPCRVRASAAFTAADMCASCHNQHATTDQWRASRYPAAGQDCNHCHMPPVERQLGDGRTRPGRGHVFPGAHDPKMLRAAGSFEARVDGDAVVVTLTNTGAGHNFPTEERHRAVDMEVRFELADGTTTAWHRAWRFRQPYRDEPGEDTQLPAGESKSARVPIPAHAVRAAARLWYRLTPYIGDDDPRSTLLEERTVELR